MFDTHLHTTFSSDCTTPPEEVIQQAITQGLSSICFTDHYDLDWPSTPEHPETFLFDIPSYFRTLQQLQVQYQGQLDIAIGIELGLQPHLSCALQEVVNAYPFDYVIGSSHLVHHQDPYYPEFFQGRQEQDAYRDYFTSILENLAAFSDIDSYGHLDYIVRYGPNQNQDYTYERYQDVLDEILTLLVQKNIALEVNTGGYKYGLGVPNPMGDIIKRYLALGGTYLTIGSDAHTPAYLGYQFSRCIDYLRSLGVTHLTKYEHRCPKQIPLDTF